MEIDFSKSAHGLIPAIIQDSETKTVLMLGYMNAEAYRKTLDTQKVSFYSRSKQRIQTEGEESGNFLHVVNIKNDTEENSFLIQVKPQDSSSKADLETYTQITNHPTFSFISKLEETIKLRRENADYTNSYVASLFEKGINKIAQKVGEEAIEVVIEAKDNNDHLFLSESADLFFHYLILLQAKGFELSDVITVLEERHK